MRKGDNKIGVIVPYGYISVAPSLINAVLMLRGAGYEVDLITAHSGEFPEHDFGDSGVVIYPYRWGRTKSFFRRMLKRVDFILWVLRTCWAKHYVPHWD